MKLSEQNLKDYASASSLTTRDIKRLIGDVIHNLDFNADDVDTDMLERLAQVTRFVCVHCTQTGQLSSRGLFLSSAAVRRHISHTQACRSAGLGHREVPIQVRAVDVMAGGGGGAGLAPSIRHQEPGTQT